MTGRVRVGFECEFMSPVIDREELTKVAEAHFGVSFRHTWPNWALKYDCSLSPRSTDPIQSVTGHELTTPPMYLSEALKTLQKIFTWIDSHGGFTNSSCGLHVGISLEDIDLWTKMDALKLLLLAEDEKILKQFNRQSYQSCHLAYIRDRRLNDLITARSHIQNGCRMSINTSYSCPGRNYIEFRSMGNTDYHKRFPEIKANIFHYAAALKLATMPDRAVELFNKKIRSELRMAA